MLNLNKKLTVLFILTLLSPIFVSSNKIRNTTENKTEKYRNNNSMIIKMENNNSSKFVPPRSTLSNDERNKLGFTKKAETKSQSEMYNPGKEANNLNQDLARDLMHDGSNIIGSNLDNQIKSSTLPFEAFSFNKNASQPIKSKVEAQVGASALKNNSNSQSDARTAKVNSLVFPQGLEDFDGLQFEDVNENISNLPLEKPAFVKSEKSQKFETELEMEKMELEKSKIEAEKLITELAISKAKAELAIAQAEKLKAELAKAEAEKLKAKEAEEEAEKLKCEEAEEEDEEEDEDKEDSIKYTKEEEMALIKSLVESELKKKLKKKKSKSKKHKKKKVKTNLLQIQETKTEPNSLSFDKSNEKLETNLLQIQRTKIEPNSLSITKKYSKKYIEKFLKKGTQNLPNDFDPSQLNNPLVEGDESTPIGPDGLLFNKSDEKPETNLLQIERHKKKLTQNTPSNYNPRASDANDFHHPQLFNPSVFGDKSTQGVSGDNGESNQLLSPGLGDNNEQAAGFPFLLEDENSGEALNDNYNTNEVDVLNNF
jgi:hypothetical protein